MILLCSYIIYSNYWYYLLRVSNESVINYNEFNEWTWTRLETHELSQLVWRTNDDGDDSAQDNNDYDSAGDDNNNDDTEDGDDAGGSNDIMIMLAVMRTALARLLGPPPTKTLWQRARSKSKGLQIDYSWGSTGESSGLCYGTTPHIGILCT